MSMLLNFIAILCPKYFMSGKKAPCNGRSLDLKKAFDFQPVTYSVFLSFINSNVLTVG